MKRTVFVLVCFGLLHFSPQPCTSRGSTNDLRASSWHSSHSSTHDEEESQKTSSHPNDQKTSGPLSQHDQSEGVTAARQKAKDTEHAGPVLSPVKNIHREEQVLDHRLKNDDNETAPIQSYPTNGRTKPKKPMAVWDQTEGSWIEDVSPFLMKTQDTSGTLSRRPQKGSIKEAPGNGSIKEALEKVSNKEDPVNGSIKETPEKGSIKETPEKGSIKEAPGRGSIKEAPGNGSIKEAQEKGSINEASGNTPIKETSGKGSIKEAPAKGFIKEAPAKGFIKEAPAKGFIKEAPAKGFIKEAPAKGFIKEASINGYIKKHNENQAVLTDPKTDLGETHTAPKLPQKRQNKGGIGQHARKGQNEHETVSASPTKDRFENDPVSQHTHRDENVPGYTPDPWRQDVTGKGTTSSPLQQDHEEMDAVALPLKKNQIKAEPVPHIGKANGHGNSTALPPFGKEPSAMAANKATNEADTNQNSRKGRANESSSAAQPPREKERTVVLKEGGNTMEAEAMVLDSKATPHKRDVYNAVHRGERAANSDSKCRCAKCNDASKVEGNFVNIVYNKPASASSTYSHKWKPCLLADGFLHNNKEEYCMHTSDADIRPWTEIDMGGVYTIEVFTIVRRELQPVDGHDSKRFWGLQALVDGEICYTWPVYGDVESLVHPLSTTTFKTSCYHELTGRYLRFEKRDLPNYGRKFQIVFCEVKVMVCKPNFFGKTSCRPCPAECKYVCNNRYGCQTFVPWNLAIKKKATQSSVLWGNPNFAVDGSIGGKFPTRKCTATSTTIDGAGSRYWQVDLGDWFKVFKVYVHNRVDELGSLLKHFDVFVESKGMVELLSPTKKCASHRRKNLKNGDEVELTCDTSKHNEGQFVILVTSRPFLLQICEVRVIGHNVTEFEAGKSCADRSEVRRCHLDHICVNDVCNINVGSNCSSNSSLGNETYCIAGTVCDGGECRLDFDQNCTGKESLCIHGFECDPGQAKCNCKKYKYGPTCSDTCGRCADNQPCNSSTGHCQACLAGWTSPPLCTTAVPGLFRTEHIVVGGTAAVLLFWLLLAVLHASWLFLYDAGYCPCCVGYKRRKKEEGGEDAEVSSDTGQSSKWSRFRKFISCGGAGVAFLGVLFCIPCRKLLSDKFRSRKDDAENMPENNLDPQAVDAKHTGTSHSGFQTNLLGFWKSEGNNEEAKNQENVDAKHMATSQSGVKKNRLAFWRKDGSNEKAQNQVQFDAKHTATSQSHALSSDQYASLIIAMSKKRNVKVENPQDAEYGPGYSQQQSNDGNRLYIDPHHSHDLSSDQYSSLMIAVNKNRRGTDVDTILKNDPQDANQSARDPTGTILHGAIL
ncbi:uncharacterized protein [Littorina saxatilis]|uniref:uncharacterized protein n=1 Tax=Littorina saxatilis TaxID=31220 RepID=UPI0038B5518B